MHPVGINLACSCDRNPNDHILPGVAVCSLCATRNIKKYMKTVAIIKRHMRDNHI